MLRIVIGQPGSADGPQDVVALARSLRDAGHEVIHAGSQEDVEPLAEAAVQEDADAVALVLDPGDESRAGPIRDLLLARGAGDIAVVEGSTAVDVLARIRDLG